MDKRKKIPTELSNKAHAIITFCETLSVLGFDFRGFRGDFRGFRPS